ncbi:MAG: ABC transporter permease [Anaeroplasmataceae bacterium]|nr:ABC transporter permease [Anaeroplasmataceae bacterium]
MVEEIKDPINDIEVQTEELTVVDEVHNSNENGSQEETYKEMSPLRLVVRRFFRSKLSIVGVVMIIGLFIFSFLGPLVCRMTGYGKAWTEDAWQLNGSIETKADRREITSIVQEYFYYTDPETGKEYPILQEVEITRNLNAKASPSKDHFLGTDSSGYDIFVRLMYGGRISLAIGFIVVILETVLGVILGGIAGYFGKWVDQVIMRIVDIFNCIPTLPILLIASALLDGWHINDSSRIYWLMVIITIFGWSGTARMVRGQILSLREQEYITATEVMGLPTWRKIFKHLIPNVMPQLIVSMTLGLGSVILYESTLSYLGLGVQMPLAAWGTMISGCNDPVVLRYYSYMWLPAGFLIVIAVLGFNFVGDGLRDAMDPKAKK